MVDYAALHKNPNGAGDARPTASQVIVNSGLTDAWTGRVVVVTGSSSGIGVETVRALAETGATIIATARNLPKARDALAGIGKTDQVRIVQLDNNSLDSVRKGAEEILQIAPKINVLITNAGIMATPREVTQDGFEAQIGVNHLSHFLLFEQLRPALAAASSSSFASRVVALTSSAHRRAQPDFDNLFWEKEGTYNKWAAYGASKTANVWFANEVERKYGSGSSQGAIHAWSVHPGIIPTGLQTYLTPEEIEGFKNNQAMQIVSKTVPQGAASTVWAATAPELEGKGGKFIENCQVITNVHDPALPYSEGYVEWTYSPEKEAKLWEVSQMLVGI